MGGFVFVNLLVCDIIFNIYAFSRLFLAFIQSNLQCIQAIHFIFNQYVCSLGIDPTTFCAANAMLYHRTTGTLMLLLLKAVANVKNG